jgi:hypothetical protein
MMSQLPWLLLLFMLDKHVDESNGVLFHIDLGKFYSSHFVERFCIVLMAIFARCYVYVMGIL